MAQIGIMGKHPGYGDFVRSGISDPVADTLSTWLDQTLFDLRQTVDDGWEPLWDGAQNLRFWIGRGIAGATLAGVFRASRDKVGRRYPLLLLAEGVALEPPVNDPDQGIYETLDAHLDRVQPGDGATALLAGLDTGFPQEDAARRAQGAVVWAHHPEGDLTALLKAAAPVDQSRAQAARSYWWAPGTDTRAPVWLAAPGLPGAQALGWLLGGVPAINHAPATEDADA